MLSTDKTTTWKSATLPEKFLQRTFSFEKRKSTKSDRVERRSPLDNRVESRSGRNNGLSCQEQEASSTAIEKSLRATLLQKTVKNSRIRRAMSCKGHSTLQQQKTLHSGWLSKTGGWPKTIKRRWFEIKGDQLYYFRQKGDVKPLAGIPLAGNQVVRRPGDATHQFQFEIVSGDQRVGKPVTDSHNSYLFIASSQTDLEQWAKAINIVIYTPLGGGMFGRAIEDTVRVDLRRGGGMVPIILEKCVECIRNYERLEEGVFRLNGNVQDVDDMKERFNKGEIVDLIGETHGIHTVASLLKGYLRSLPEPVIPFYYYEELRTVTKILKKDQNEGVEKLLRTLNRIPRANFNTLKYISRFLSEFEAHHEVTKMTLENLAVVFGPNFLSPQSQDPQMLMESSSMIAQLMEYFIKNHATLFPVTEDERYYKPKSPNTTPPRNRRPLRSNDGPQPSKPFVQCALLPALAIMTNFDCPTLDEDSAEFSFSSEDGAAAVKKSSTFPRLSRIASLGSRKSLDASLNGVMEDGAEHDYQAQVHELVGELELQRTQFEEQVRELETDLDVQRKVVAMLKIRLHEEHKARTAAEERLELYKLGIEEYCQKFGGVDINLP